MPSSARERCRARAKASPSTMPRTAPSTAMATDSSRSMVRRRRRLRPTASADLAHPLDDRQCGVDDAEHRDDDGQPEQRVHDEEELVDRLALGRGELGLVVDAHGRQVRHQCVEVAAEGGPVGARLRNDVDRAVGRWNAEASKPSSERVVSACRTLSSVYVATTRSSRSSPANPTVTVEPTGSPSLDARLRRDGDRVGVRGLERPRHDVRSRRRAH